MRGAAHSSPPRRWSPAHTASTLESLNKIAIALRVGALPFRRPPAALASNAGEGW